LDLTPSIGQVIGQKKDFIIVSLYWLRTRVGWRQVKRGAAKPTMRSVIFCWAALRLATTYIYAFFPCNTTLYCAPKDLCKLRLQFTFNPLYYANIFKDTHMDHILPFITHNWPWAILLVALIVAYIIFEFRQKSFGGTGLAPDMATLKMNQKNAIIIDLRGEDAFKDGHIARSKNIVPELLHSKLKSLQKHKESPVILVCASGQNSSVSSTLLRQNGFTDVNQLKGGITAWRTENLPLVKPGHGKTDSTEENTTESKPKKSSFKKHTGKKDA
jgi:rhodanese-related sulfurtransferase